MDFLTSTVVIVVLVGVFVLTLLSKWKIFVKYGEPGWKGLIPFYSIYVESKKVWTTGGGIAMIICLIVASLYYANLGAVMNYICYGCGIAAYVMHIIICSKKATAFHESFGMALVLLFVPFLGNAILGFGDSKYYGN